MKNPASNLAKQTKNHNEINNKVAILKACIFDLDGVLVDTAKYHFLAWKRLAEELNISFELAHNEKLKGISRMDSLDIILALGDVEIGEERKNQLAEKKNNWYVDYIMKMKADEILPGTLNLLDELKTNDIKIALGSSSKNAPTILNQCNLNRYFDAIVDGNSIKNSKPHPEVFELGAEKLGLSPENCVVFEDAEAGIEAAKNAGMKSIGVGPVDSLSAADMVIDSLEMIDLEGVKLIVQQD